MGLFDRVRELFRRAPGPYEEAQKERVEAIRGALGEDAPTLDAVRACIALISETEEDKVKADSRLLEDLELGDVEMMELELLCEDMFGIRISGSEMRLLDTLGDLASLIDRKIGKE